MKGKYRKKPIVVEAEQFFPSVKPWPEGVEQYEVESTETVLGMKNIWYGWRVQTLAGSVEVRPGDVIVTGIQGERYPVTADIFQDTYEVVETWLAPPAEATP